MSPIVVPSPLGSIRLHPCLNFNQSTVLLFLLLHLRPPVYNSSLDIECTRKAFTLYIWRRPISTCFQPVYLLICATAAAAAAAASYTLRVANALVGLTSALYRFFRPFAAFDLLLANRFQFHLGLI